MQYVTALAYTYYSVNYLGSCVTYYASALSLSITAPTFSFLYSDANALPGYECFAVAYNELLVVKLLHQTLSQAFLFTRKPAKVSKHFLLRHLAKKAYHRTFKIYFRLIKRGLALGLGEAAAVYLESSATSLFNSNLFYILFALGGSNIFLNFSRQMDFHQYAKANALLPKLH